MTKKKLLALFVLFVLLFVLVSPMLHINSANVAKADSPLPVCRQMRCDCYVPYNYMGGRIWEGYPDTVFLTCSGWRPITPCEPYC